MTKGRLDREESALYRPSLKGGMMTPKEREFFERFDRGEGRMPVSIESDDEHKKLEPLEVFYALADEQGCTTDEMMDILIATYREVHRRVPQEQSCMNVVLRVLEIVNGLDEGSITKEGESMTKQCTYEVGEEVVVIATGVRGEVVDKLGAANYEVKHPGSVKTLFYRFKELVSVKNGR